LRWAAADWFAPVPADVLEGLSRLRHGRRERFFAFCQGNKYLRPFRTFLALPGLKLRLSYLLGLLAPSRDYMAQRYQTQPETPLWRAHLGRLGRLALRPLRRH
jgi:hypothetical protein